MKHELEKIRLELCRLRATVEETDATVPLRKVLDMAYEAVDHAFYEAVRVDDPTENATTYGTGERCICPHCGKLIKELFDDGYTTGEHYEMHCPHCQAHYTVLVENVYSTVNIVLDDAASGICWKCFHWAHKAGECEPYKMDCACSENTE